MCVTVYSTLPISSTKREPSSHSTHIPSHTHTDTHINTPPEPLQRRSVPTNKTYIYVCKTLAEIGLAKILKVLVNQRYQKVSSEAYKLYTYILYTI